MQFGGLNRECGLNFRWSLQQNFTVMYFLSRNITSFCVFEGLSWISLLLESPMVICPPPITIIMSNAVEIRAVIDISKGKYR